MDILAFGKNIQSSLQYNFIKVFLEVRSVIICKLQTKLCMNFFWKVKLRKWKSMLITAATYGMNTTSVFNMKTHKLPHLGLTELIPNRFSETITLSSDIIVWPHGSCILLWGKCFYHKHAVPAIGSWWGNKTPSEQEAVYQLGYLVWWNTSILCSIHCILLSSSLYYNSM